MKNPQQPYDLNDYTPEQTHKSPYDLSSAPAQTSPRCKDDERELPEGFNNDGDELDLMRLSVPPTRI